MFKMMMFPEQVFYMYMINLTAEGLKNEYRRLAKLIHPDKNNHPKAGHAFQKLSHFYVLALKRFS
jgi:uncharacterized protein YktA (UPF0223 family)